GDDMGVSFHKGGDGRRCGAGAGPQRDAAGVAMKARALPLLLAASAACSSPAVTSYRGTLAIDIRDQLAVTVAPRGDGAADVALTFQGAGLGLFDAAAPLVAAGRVEPFPEAGLVLYTGRFRAAPAPGGPCGAQPVSLALSL